MMARASKHPRDLSGKGGVREEWLLLDICDLRRDRNFCFTTKSARAPDIEVVSFRVKQIFINRVCRSWLDDTGGLYR
jgi:hypothetical protein